MFYAQFVLAKKGPLARIWLAAHWDKKLTKAHVFETNIEKSVDGILQPKVKMALRTSGHLLLGVVRIYSRKAKYLLADCNEAFVKIKMAFRPGVVDLPEDIREAAVSAITLPEVFHDFDQMPELSDVDIQAQFTLNQSRAEEITMREEYNISLVAGDEGFGEMGFEDTPELMRNASINHTFDQSHIMFSENLEKDKDPKDQDSRVETSALNLEAPINGDGFGGNLGQDLLGGGDALFSDEALFNDTDVSEPPPLVPEVEKPPPPPPPTPKDEDSDDDMNDNDAAFPSPAPVSSDDERPLTPVEAPKAVSPAKEVEESQTEQQNDQTTLIHNEEESFALGPIDTSAIKSGWPRTKRKRKLIVDEVKNISGEEMKSQLSDTTDIVTTLDLAPPSRRLMHWKETGGVEKLFALPGRLINANCLSTIYQRNLTSEHCVNEDFGMAGDEEIDNLRLEQVGDDDDAAVDKSTLRPRGRPPKRKVSEVDTPEVIEIPPKRVQPPRKCFDELLTPEVPEQEPENASASEAASQDVEMAPVPEDDLLHDSHDELTSPRGQEPSLMSPPPPPPENSALVADAQPPENPQPPMPEVPPPPEDETPIQNESTMEVEREPHPPTPPPVQEPEPEELPNPEADEEQADDETYEEFEERVVNKRAYQLFSCIKKKLKKTNIHLSSLTHNSNRKQVAQKFYTFLVLKKLQAVELMQDEAYADIQITKGLKFDNAAL